MHDITLDEADSAQRLTVTMRPRSTLPPMAVLFVGFAQTLCCIVLTSQVMDPQAAQRVGPNGPLLLQDFHLIDILAHFDRERIPERVVHAKGAGAYGQFEVTDDISDIVCCLLFSVDWTNTDAFTNRQLPTCSMALRRRPTCSPVSQPSVVRRDLLTVLVTLVVLL